jgi:hypothetical protein
MQKQNEKTHHIVYIKALVFLTIFAYFAWLSIAVFPDFPTNFDEYGYYTQAKIFAQGKLFVTPHPFDHNMLESHMRTAEGRVFSKYLPGFIAVLSVFWVLGFYKLANPAIMTVGLFFCARILECYTSARAALVITLLAAFLPYSMGYTASLFSQPLAMCLASIALWAFIEYQHRAEERYLYIIGIVCAYGFLTRPIDFVAVTGAICIAFFFCQPWRRALLCSISCGLMALVGLWLLALYNSYLTGRPSFLGYEGYFAATFHVVGDYKDPMEVRIYKDVIRYAQNFMHLGIPVFEKHFLPLVGIASTLLAVGGIAFVRHYRAAWVVPLYIFLLVLIYNLYPQDAWNTYGARYWFAAWGGFIVMAGFGWCAIERATQKRPYTRMLLALGIIVSIVSVVYTKSAPLQETYAERFRLNKIARTNLEKKCPLKTIVVLTGQIPHPIADNNQFVENILLRQNTLTDNSRVIVSSLYNEQRNKKMLSRLQEKFPGYAVCEYQVDYYEH